MDIDFLVEKVHRLLLDNLPVRTSKTPSGWITMDCPMCSDKRKRGGLITTGARISYNCFNCGFTTGWAPNPALGKKFGISCWALVVSNLSGNASGIEPPLKREFFFKIL